MERFPNQLERIRSKEDLKKLETTGEYLFHGSPYLIDLFEPKQVYTDIDGKPIPDGEPAVFASAEIETPLFRSIFHESRFDELEGSFEVGFSNSKDNEVYIHANKAAIDACKGASGYVYVFKKSDFKPRGNEEWTTNKEVRPESVFYSHYDDIGLPIHSSNNI